MKRAAHRTFIHLLILHYTHIPSLVISVAFSRSPSFSPKTIILGVMKYYSRVGYLLFCRLVYIYGLVVSNLICCPMGNGCE